MNLDIFHNSDIMDPTVPKKETFEGPLLEKVSADIIKEWWTRSGWDYPKFEKILSKLFKLNVRVCPDEVLNRLLGRNKTEDIEHLFYIGNLHLLDSPSVSVVGTRTPTMEGIRRAAKVSHQLVKLGYVVMSGLAKGIDKVAHESTLDVKGKTIAILGVPFHKTYPNENIPLLNRIINEGGLCITPAMPYQEHGTWLFPRRNKLMAILSQATIVVEAGPTSGVRHQAAECLRKNRKLIFLQSLAEKSEIDWVQGFIKSGGIIVDDSKSLEDALT